MCPSHSARERGKSRQAWSSCHLQRYVYPVHNWDPKFSVAGAIVIISDVARCMLKQPPRLRGFCEDHVLHLKRMWRMSLHQWHRWTCNQPRLLCVFVRRSVTATVGERAPPYACAQLLCCTRFRAGGLCCSRFAISGTAAG